MSVFHFVFLFVLIQFRKYFRDEVVFERIFCYLRQLTVFRKKNRQICLLMEVLLRSTYNMGMKNKRENI